MKFYKNAETSDPGISIEVQGLTRKFASFTAVDGISFQVKSGEIFGLLGANGAGKTTVIRMLAGLLKPTAGEGRVAGLDINREYEKIKARIGYMSQKFSLYDDLKVEENLIFFGGIYGLSFRQVASRLEELEISLNIRDFKQDLTASLPPGVKQRLALACAILHRPSVLFLDEPTSGVDPVVRRYFWDLISALTAAGTTVFVTTHYMDEAEYCNRITIMYQGKIVALDAPQQLKNNYQMKTIEEIFIHLVDK